MRYLGVDLHTNSFTVAYMSEAGKVRLREFGLSDLKKFKRSLKETDRLAVEATGNTRWFVNEIEGLIEKVVVVDPRKFEVINKSVSKTDKKDATTLARYLSKEMLPEARMKNKEQAQLSSLVVTRDKLVKLRTSLLNKVHNILNAHGIKSQKKSLSSNKGLERVLALDLDPNPMFELGVIVDQVKSLNVSIRKLEERIKGAGQKLEGHENLKSIKGIGDQSAAILLSVIGDINDFESEGKLASYFGIVPRVSNSNETERHGRITKRGSKIGRTTLVQCALAAKRYNLYYQKYYDRIQARRGAGKAIIALARKLLDVVYRTLKEKWIFEDFPNFVLAET